MWSKNYLKTCMTRIFDLYAQRESGLENYQASGNAATDPSNNLMLSQLCLCRWKYQVSNKSMNVMLILYNCETCEEHNRLRNVHQVDNSSSIISITIIMIIIINYYIYLRKISYVTCFMIQKFFYTIKLLL